MTIRNGLFFLFTGMLWLPVLVGCGNSTAQFSQNRVAARAAETLGGVDEGLSKNLYQQIVDIQAAIFGTPDKPEFVAGGGGNGFR